MISEEDLFELCKRFDKYENKVVTTVPHNIKLSEVIGLQSYPDGHTKLTIKRGQGLLLCVVSTKDIQADILRWKEEIKKRAEPKDRWEPWELFGCTTPMDKANLLLTSRLKNKREKEELWR